MIILGYLCGSDTITRLLITGREEIRVSSRKCDHKTKEEAISQECRQPLPASNKVRTKS